MLKIRNLLFALSLSPLLSLAWQLPNQAQAQVLNRSSTTAGGNSGASTAASTLSIFSSPTTGNITRITILPGISPNITNGVSTGGSIPGGGTNVVSPNNIEPNSPNINVQFSTTGSGSFIGTPPAVQNNLNQLAAKIINPPPGQAPQLSIAIIIIQGRSDAAAAAAQLQGNFVRVGVSPASVQVLVTALRGLFDNRSASLPNLPVAQATSGQLVATTKALKPISVIAQADALPNVNLNELNNAIVAYNGIILESDAETLKKLSKDEDFRSIGKILRELRDAIQ